MSAKRFQSTTDYFAKRSGLTQKIIQTKQRRPAKRSVQASPPVSLVMNVFCPSVVNYEVEGEGRFDTTNHDLAEAVGRHIDGSATVLVDPRSREGATAWHVVCFDLSETVDHPFSKARDFVAALDDAGISSHIEVTEGGKGHYHVWLFHEKPIQPEALTRALGVLGLKLFGFRLDVAPVGGMTSYVPLPFQGESALMQRRVFVNAVGKMLKDQPGVLEQLSFVPSAAVDRFIASMERQPELHAGTEVPKPKAPAAAVATPEPRKTSAVEDTPLKKAVAPVVVRNEKPDAVDPDMAADTVVDIAEPEMAAEPEAVVVPEEVAEPEVVIAPEEAVETENGPRSDAVAVNTEPVPDGTPVRDDVHVIIDVGGDQYALPKAAIVAYADQSLVMTLPGAPGGLRGVILHAGRIAPVYDAASILGTKAGGQDRRMTGRIVICSTGTEVCAICVDAVIREHEGVAGDELPVQPGDLLARAMRIIPAVFGSSGVPDAVSAPYVRVICAGVRVAFPSGAVAGIRPVAATEFSGDDTGVAGWLFRSEIGEATSRLLDITTTGGMVAVPVESIESLRYRPDEVFVLPSSCAGVTLVTGVAFMRGGPVFILDVDRLAGLCA